MASLPARCLQWQTTVLALQLDHIPLSISAALGLHPVARTKLLLMYHPAEGRRLSWSEYTLHSGLADEYHQNRTCLTQGPEDVLMCDYM